MRDERDLLIPAYGVHRRQNIPLQDLLAVLWDQGWPVYVLPGAPNDRETFFASARAVLPLNPPVQGERSWDALEDSLWEGLHELHAEKVAIVWPDAQALAQGDPESFQIALDVFKKLVFSLADPKFAVDHVTRVLVLQA